MTYGNTIIKKCSSCENLIQEETINSSNNIGAVYWTDGKCEAPMLPDQPWLVICPHCKTALWIDELEKVGEIGFGDDISTRMYQTSLSYVTPELSDYMALLETEIKSTEKERYIRLKALWSGNDERRRSSSKRPLSLQEMSNLESYAKMLDISNENDIIMKAEIMRELGNFDAAQILLSKVNNTNLSQAVEIISSLVKQGNCYVERMEFN